MQRTLRRGASRRAGQAMVEYALALLVVVFIALGARWLVSSLRGNGERTLDLVSSEYP